MITTANTVEIKIYIAGDPAIARTICRQYCMDVGLCVTVEDVDYIYTGGAEIGVRVGLINYPRFPASTDDIMMKARELANLLMVGLCQHSYSIVGPTETEWFSRRPA
jgi:hypothetical protein